MKLLYILNVANRVNNFSYTSMMAAQKLGIEFHIAGNWSYTTESERKKDEEKYGIHIYQIDFIRNPFNPRNYKAYEQLSAIIKEGNFDAVHCNTPIGGVLGRICARKYKVNRVIYQAHGFHFYKGAPFLNWILYYPIERMLARLTDAIITINEEDYKRSNAFKLRKKGKSYYVKGVGIDYTAYCLNENIRKIKRTDLGLSSDDVMIISMGSLDSRKNYSLSLEVIAKINRTKVKYFICGTGRELERLKKQSEKLSISQDVYFLGFRNDIKELLAASDIFLFTTRQEGLPRAMMEAMAAGLPCVVSDVRGNIELINASNGLGGYLCPLKDNGKQFAEKLNLLINNSQLRRNMGKENVKVIDEFGVDNITKEMLSVYVDVFGLARDYEGENDDNTSYATK